MNKTRFSGLVPRLRAGLPVAALVLAVFLCYLAVWFAGFLWDDDFHLTSNPCIVGPLGLKAMWTTGLWSFCPLVLVTFWAEHLLWGLWPVPYHVVSVALHAAGTVLLWRVLRELRVPGAWLGAALWGMHPVQVESVAWVSEMKNTLSGVFYLLAILFFAKSLTSNESDSRGGKWNRALTLLCAALAMAAKPSTVILPAVLALVAWWVEGRWNWRHLRVLAPMLLLAAVFSALTIGLPHSSTSLDSRWVQPWPDRLVTAGDAVWFYLGKLLWPYPLMAVYPRWTIDAHQFLAWQYLVTLVGLLGLLALNRAPAGRAVFFAFAYFILALLPALGLVSFGYSRYSFVADHFQYLASMGPLALAGAAIVRFSRSTFSNSARAQRAIGTAALLILAVLSWQRGWAFVSEEALQTDTLAKNPNCAVAHNNLGNVMVRGGWYDHATVQFREALAADPWYAEAHNNLGIAFARTGRFDEAIAEYRKTLALDPAFAEAYVNMGVALAHSGQADEAIGMFRQGLQLNPDDAKAHYNLAGMLLHEGRVDEALAQYQVSLEIDPGNVKARHNLAAAVLEKEGVGSGADGSTGTGSQPGL